MLVELVLADPRWMSIGPGALDECPPNAPVPGLGDAETAHPLAGRALARHQAEIAHELTRAVEPAEIANLSNDRRSCGEADAAQGLQRLDERRQRPLRHELDDGRLYALKPFLRVP